MDAIIRSAPFRLTDNSAGLTLEGYAAVFDTPTQINSWEGRFTEVIRRGAFAKAVRSNPRPVMQFDHGTHPYIGSIPIGAVEELREDDDGLYVRARLHSGEFFQPVREAITSGAIKGMSFKFTIPKGGVEVSHEDGEEVRTLTQVDLHELGPVVWPAYKETSVGVRMAELADLLRTDADARHDLITALIFEDLADRSEPTAEEDDPSAPEGADRSEAVRPEPSASKARRQTRAAIVAAQAERAIRQYESKERDAT